MATKPALPLEFATNAIYTAPDAGPFPGDANKVAPPNYLNGFLPGNPIAAEHANSLFNTDSLWNVWVFAGSSAPGADAHIVETNAGGQANVLLMEIGTAVLGALAAKIQNSSNIFEALEVTNHDPDGAGASITAGGTGLTVAAGDTGIRCTGGPGSPAASFFKTAGAAVRGGLHTEPQSDPSTYTEGDFHITPSLPGIGQRGRTHLVRSDRTDGGTQFLKAWETNKGYYFRHAEDRSESSNATDTPQNKLTLSANPGSGGKYKVTFSCTVETTTSVDVVVGVTFDTGIAGKTRTYLIQITSAGRKEPVSATWVVDGNAANIVCSIDFFSFDDGPQVNIFDAEICFEGSHDEIA